MHSMKVESPVVSMPRLRTMGKPTWMPIGLFCFAFVSSWSGACPGAELKVTATEYRRTQIYHSPQTPGFTCWTGTRTTPR